MTRNLRAQGLLAALFVFLADQASKAAVLYASSIPETPVEVTSFFNLVLVWNRGVSFGLFAHQAELARWALTALGMGLSALVAVWLWRSRHAVGAWGTGLILGGAVGNILDRLLYGAVVDFLDFHLAGWHWPAFNVADSAICIGVCLLLVESFFLHEKPSAHAS